MLVINSILKNNNSNSDYTFYIIGKDLPKIGKLYLKNFVVKNKQKIEIIDYSNPMLKTTSPTNRFNSSITKARIELPNILPKSVKKVLYLDADVLVVEDLKKLYDIDLANEHAGMVYDAYIYKKGSYTDGCGFKYNKNYFNSGVILMNIEKWREDKITEKMLSFVAEHKDRFVYKTGVSSCIYEFPDQDLINKILYGKIKPIDRRWNHFFGHHKNPAIYHYAGVIKPWEFIDNDERTKLYNEYWSKSSLKHIRLCYMLSYKLYYLFLRMKDEYIERCKEIFSRYNLL